MNHYLVYYSGVEQNFRLPEFESLCDLMKVRFSVVSGNPDKDRYFVIHTEDKENLCKAVGRSMLIHQVTELWGHGTNLDELRSASREYLDKTKFDIPTESWKYNVIASNKRGMPISKQVEYVEEFGISFDGPVNLSSPQHILDLYLDFGEAKSPERPVYYYCGRRLCDSGRDILPRYDTKGRAFIGNTAMCPLMAFLMANQGQVVDGALVLDPFVGSGGLTVVCAEFGGYSLGSDINITLLRGRGRSVRGYGYRKTDENFRGSYEQYGTLSRFIDVIASDQHRPPWRSTMLVDAIITDPPYGIREATRKKGSEQQTIKYQTPDLVEDLLGFAAHHLLPGGRLVYFLPVIMASFELDDVPKHPQFRFISASPQLMRAGLARVLVTMEKLGQDQVPVSDDVSWREQCQNLEPDLRDEYYSKLEARSKERRECSQSPVEHKGKAEEETKDEGAARAEAP
eukprot:scpid27391/ scgid25432/ tRNA (guanine(10)-N2)-methyltransferase homolog; tRNA guanosine-2&apos